NQLMAIGTTAFQYDGYGRRSQNGAGVSFVYDGLNPVQEIVGGSVRASLVTGGLDEYFARTDSSGTSSFLTDALGSTVALADSTATLQTNYAYEPFGNSTSTGASSMNVFEYTGRENDGSGMYYYRARYYNAVLQRFIAEDPLVFDGGDADLYAYVFNQPTAYRDPSGKLGIGAVIGGVIGGITGAMGAKLQGGSTGDIVAGAIIGAAAGVALGFVDPTEGVLTVGRYALLGGEPGDSPRVSTFHSPSARP
ncbi:MAG TPA: RHS repeat-associated core domain-containing protein, partial [Bryobacteraceae bacterium]|nr:RHS repeat-associated core domain-containing protein [Bryobacteraceae bacterium]